MKTQSIWNDYKDELYFFILKKVKNKTAANDIFQNTFLKIHKNLPTLKDEDKIKAWIFQIARNEIINWINKEAVYTDESTVLQEVDKHNYQDICCFDKFINNLPTIYEEVIELVYIKGYKQKEASQILGISLANVKARIRRAKAILKQNFNECCKYDLDKNGLLMGEPNCPICKTL